MDPFVAQLILEDRKIAYAITDSHLKVVAISPTLPTLYNLEDQRVLGRSLFELVPELIGSETVLANILAGQMPHFELAWVNRQTNEGQTIYLNLVHLPYRVQTDVIGLIHLVQDVTEIGTVQQQLTQHRNELRLLQEQLVRQNSELAAVNAELRQLTELKSSFISIAAHELRSPLTAIVGYAELLFSNPAEPLTDDQYRSLEIIQKSADRLIKIVNDLLDIARIEAERIELALQPIDLPALLSVVIEEYRPQWEAKAQRVQTYFQPDLPFALCDETRMTQIISNLISNAIKYTPDNGEIAIRLTSEVEGFLQVSVKDSGVGISVEDQANLFRRFFRAKNASSTGAAGAGLGLFITRSFVELQGGQIWFESKLGQGSTFHVTIPLAGRPPTV